VTSLPKGGPTAVIQRDWFETERTLGPVVVQRHALVVEEDAKLDPLVVGVTDSGVEGPLGHDARDER
jgi:hypothetical protein